MASILSEQIAHDLFTDGVLNQKARRLVLEIERDQLPHSSGWSESALASRVDLQLKEAREVLKDLLDLAERIGETETCQRARALYERLEMKK